ncbi:asparaginase [Gordonia sp. L191]|uniref:asparaginase n=1 Tax=Gordonia sp. L191 TaxID=2982699 RepID=UPI0024BF7039|nr:asparaginase [Gordonia sp. L191]WHU48376.1 asparaginase [Gordonia sp. L191]
MVDEQMPDAGSGWVAVLGTGGTIASRRDADGVIRPGGATPDFGPTATPVRVTTVMSRDSSTFDFAAMDRIVDAVEEALTESGCLGVVVLHGTDTLEESALAVDLFHDDPRPVVFTGAQRSADHADPDGPANAGHAVATVMDPANRGRGVLVCFGGTVHAARGVRKVHTTARDGFAGTPVQRQILRRVRLQGIRVDVVALYPGADEVVIDALVAAGAHGLVLEAMGSGNANQAIIAAVRRAVESGVRVVVTTRVAFGTIAPSYGGGADLVAAGASWEPELRAGQARVALAAAVAASAAG